MNTAQANAQKAGRSETARKVVLFGWAAKGVVYLTLAYLVLQMALGSATQQATTTGALQKIAQTAPGRISLVVLGVGLLAFAVGRVLEVTTLAGPQIEAKDKVVAAVLAFLYVSLAITAFSIVGLVGSSSGSGGSGGSGGGGSNEQQGSAFLLGLPGGQYIVGIVGLAIIAFGVLQAWKGIQQDFLATLRTAAMSSGVRTGVTRLGTAAYITKGVILALLGYFLLQSAITYDSSQARGLDAALREVAEQSWGTAALVLIAIGLLAYALFTFCEARYRKVGSSASGT